MSEDKTFTTFFPFNLKKTKQKISYAVNDLNQTCLPSKDKDSKREAMAKVERRQVRRPQAQKPFIKKASFLTSYRETTLPFEDGTKKGK